MKRFLTRTQLQLLLREHGHTFYSTDPEETLMVGKQPLEYRNTNNLVRKPEWDITVQKTGYT